MNYYKTGLAFNDTLDSLKEEFKFDKSNDIIVLGACWLDYSYFLKFKKQYNKIIVFNQEQLNATQRDFLSKKYFAWLKSADEVWDYDEENIKVLKLIRPDIKLHLLKPYKIWKENFNKDIDILFYGTLNKHRELLLYHLKKKYNVCVLHNVYDYKKLDNYILRSKILLNIHYYDECSLQEQARMIRWIGAPCRIISEKSIHNYLGIEEMTYEELFDLEL